MIYAGFIPFVNYVSGLLNGIFDSFDSNLPISRSRDDTIELKRAS